jgi:selenoprotein W-related protein
MKFKKKITELVLVPGDGGCFEVDVNGERVYSKLETGKFPEHPDILKACEKRLK